jgi:hypothetical protein
MLGSSFAERRSMLVTFHPCQLLHGCETAPGSDGSQDDGLTQRPATENEGADGFGAAVGQDVAVGD